MKQSDINEIFLFFFWVFAAFVLIVCLIFCFEEQNKKIDIQDIKINKLETKIIAAEDNYNKLIIEIMRE